MEELLKMGIIKKVATDLINTVVVERKTNGDHRGGRVGDLLGGGRGNSLLAGQIG